MEGEHASRCGMSGSTAEEIVERLRETSGTLQQELARNQRESAWRIAVGLLLVLGVVLGAVLIVPAVATDDAAVMRRQRLQLAAEKVAATGSKLVSALTMMSHHVHAARSEKLSELPFHYDHHESTRPYDGDLQAAIAAEVEKGLERKSIAEKELGKDTAELKWVRQELKESLAQKRQAADSLAIQQEKEKEKNKEVGVVTDELMQLKQEVKDREEELASARTRISKGEEALLGKELEIAELKKHLAKHTQLAAQKEATEKAQCECKKAGGIYTDAMSCEKDLNKVTQELTKVQDTLHHTQTELNLKKRDFRKFLGILQGTWSETKTLKSQIDALQADNVLSSDGGKALSTKDKVLQLLGLVNRAPASSSSLIPDAKSYSTHASW